MSLLGHLKMADGYSKQPEPDAFERSRHTLPFIRHQKPLKNPSKTLLYTYLNQLSNTHR